MNKPIRVLQVVTVMNMGGIENFLMNLYRAIDRTKVQFDFLVFREERGAFDDEIEELGGLIYRMQPLRPHKFFTNRSQLKVFFQKHREYQIVHSHLNANSTLVLSVAKKMEVPVRIAHAHTDREGGNNQALKNILKQLLGRYSTHNYGCSINAGKWLYGNRPFMVVNNAIDSSRFVYDIEKAMAIKEQLNITNRLVLGHIGSFTRVKNHSFLIDLFEEIQKRLPESLLLLIGDGNLKDEIQEKVKTKKLEDKVWFLGVRKDVNELLQAFDFILMPSLFEGLPVSLVEAQASGLKIFASDQIAKETDITGNVHFLPIDKGVGKWCESVLHYIGYQRKNMQNKIINAGYDVKANVEKMQNFYLSEFEKL